jgi:SAM-dependent methyltransferase
MELRKYYDTVYKTGIWTEERLDPRKLSKLNLMLKKLRLKSGETLLDLGCGNGRYSKVFSLRGMSVVGLDISKVALDLAKKQCGECNLVLGDASRLPFRDKAFDKVFAVDIIEHVQNDFECLNEIVRVTKNTGIILISFPRNKKFFKFSEDNRLGHLHAYEKDFIKTLLEKCGLIVEICFVDALFDYICYHFDLLFKRILTHGTVDPLISPIKDGGMLICFGRKIFTFIASMDLLFSKFPLGNTFLVFARKRRS